ncbi:hypothetical protein H2198_008631 [Neophaeococcomyces mojaviensis]|uniref:Uncharacterized protein n=1 Tax=Neophaeococcomyces mojaviensis TaxID=3383035 RepID=A0ACC2ZWZ9_9EURO|nr:hypothetical protein H2198_008631 [Knufia sp. JES_112]
MSESIRVEKNTAEVNAIELPDAPVPLLPTDTSFSPAISPATPQMASIRPMQEVNSTLPQYQAMPQNGAHMNQLQPMPAGMSSPPPPGFPVTHQPVPAQTVQPTQQSEMVYAHQPQQVTMPMGYANVRAPQPQGQYQSATPIPSLGMSSAPVDCPVCGQRRLTSISYQVGNTTQ